MVQIDCSSAFDIVNHQGILYKICSVGIGGSMFPVLTQFQYREQQTTQRCEVREGEGQTYRPGSTFINNIIELS